MLLVDFDEIWRISRLHVGKESIKLGKFTVGWG